MGRRLMWGSLALTPAALLLHLVGAGSTAVFLVAAAALTPLAFLIGEATENVALHTGPAIGAFVNASLGNGPELIIALFAVGDGLPQVVRGSLAGSVVSTTLLVCGGALLAGPAAELPRAALLLQLASILIAVALFCVPSVPGFHGDPERHALYVLTVPVCALLLCLYVATTVATLRAERRPRAAVGPEARALGSSAAVLTAAALATALVSELLVHSLQSFGRSLGLSPFFVAAVIVALVGNAAEQGGAVVVARRGDPGLGAEIAVSSASQIALFVCPLVALASGLAGHDLPLSFAPVELATMGAGALAVAAAVSGGRSTRARGVGLVLSYGLAVAAFALVGSG